jgi:Zn-dependent alcohol dehydrogenase
MKAAVCRAFNEPLVIEELTLEGPQAGELVVDVKACAICHSDITYMEGGWGGDLPALYGHEAAGIVSAIGPETPGISVGDHVVVTLIRSCGQCYYCSRGDRVLCEATLPLSTRQPIKDASGAPVAQMMNVGSFAEQVLVHYSQVAVMPADVGFDVASLLGCGVITGVGAAINTAKVAQGDTVAVVGCGGVGLSALQGARIAGASRIIAVDTTPSKLELAKQLGATDVVNASEVDAVEAVLGLTGGVDHAFEALGYLPTIDQAIKMTGRGGQTTLIGMVEPEQLTEIATLGMITDERTIAGSWYGTFLPSRDWPLIVGWLESGDLMLDQMIERITLDDINVAFDRIRSNEAARQVVIF